MNGFTWRQVLGLVPAAGLAGLAGVEEEPAGSADRRAVLAAGMTEEEADCWAAAADVAGKFFALPDLHPMDDQEVANAVHVIQNKLLSRPTYRAYLAAHKAADKSGK